LTIVDAEPINLVPDLSGWPPDSKELLSLRTRLSKAPDADLHVVGSVCADPGIAIFPPRFDLVEMHKALAPYSELLLLINASTDEGAFYLWQARRFTPLGGFFEALPDRSALSIIPWNGRVQGDSVWLGVASQEGEALPLPAGEVDAEQAAIAE